MLFPAVKLLNVQQVFYWDGDCSLLFNEPPRPTQPGHPSMGRHNEYG